MKNKSPLFGTRGNGTNITRRLNEGNVTVNVWVTGKVATERVNQLTIINTNNNNNVNGVQRQWGGVWRKVAQRNRASGPSQC